MRKSFSAGGPSTSLGRIWAELNKINKKLENASAAPNATAKETAFDASKLDEKQIAILKEKLGLLDKKVSK